MFDRDSKQRRAPRERGNVGMFRLGRLAVFGLIVAVVCITILFSEAFFGTLNRVVTVLTPPITSTFVRVKKDQKKPAQRQAPTPSGPVGELVG
jgi:hypothetical protein